MEKQSKICQSCGMPMKKDELRGTNTDGSLNHKYCTYCYQEGKFLYEGNDVKEFQEFCRQKMIEGGHNKFMAWIFTRGMKRLERWKNN